MFLPGERTSGPRLLPRRLKPDLYRTSLIFEKEHEHYALPAD